jgi:transaldolase/transaldolase/glucose-6-phosphate isomerase
MSSKALKRLGMLVRSIRLDYLQHGLKATGTLQRLIEKDGPRGMAWNPSVFGNAITHSRYYDEDIRVMALFRQR